MISVRDFKLDDISKVLDSSNTGLWLIEVENDRPPRMYGNSTLISILGFDEDLSPEDFFIEWRSQILPEYHHLLLKTAYEVIDGERSELIYGRIDKNGKESLVRVGISQDTNFKNGFALYGYYQDITKISFVNKQQIDLENLPKVLAEDYYSLYSINLNINTITLEQSTNSILSGYQVSKTNDYIDWLNDYIDNFVSLSERNKVLVFENIDITKRVLLRKGKRSVVFLKRYGEIERFTEFKLIVLEYANNDISRCILIEKDVHDVIMKERKDKQVLREALANAEYTRKTLDKMIYDKLTGLYSKEYFFDQAKQFIQRNLSDELMLLSIDIEDFKAYNSIAGIHIGDELLLFIANILNVLLTDLDRVCFGRVGADLFAILIDNNEEKIRYIQRTLLRAVNEYTNETPIKLLFGEYVIKDKHEEIHIMHDKSKLAANTCKGIFGKNIGRFSDEMEEELSMSRMLTLDMKKALDLEEYELYFQPKYSATSLQICGAEVLVRWNHRKKNFILPSVFIPLFEQNGFIRYLDYYIWKKTCEYIRDEKIEIPISVNVSRANLFSNDFVESILKLVNGYNVPPQQLYLEFTETAYFSESNMIKTVLDELKSHNFLLSMDDFGSGYSSLSMLKQLPVNEIKIDSTFVNFLNDDDKALTILETVVEMSKKLHLLVTVEGIESKEQLDLVQRLGCDVIQGYYFSKPLPAKQFFALLRENGLCSE